MYTSVSIYYSKFKNLVKRIIYLPKWSGHSGWGRSWTPLHRNPALVPLLVAGPISNGPTRSSHVYVYLSSLECSLYHPYLRSRYCSCSGFPWSGGKCSSFTGIGTQAYNWYIEECVLREVMKEPLHYQCLFVWQLRRTHTQTIQIMDINIFYILTSCVFWLSSETKGLPSPPWTQTWVFL